MTKEIGIIEGNKLTHEFIENHGFRQLGSRPIWSNKAYQLHQYPNNWGIFKRDFSNVIYRDTGLSLRTEDEFLQWYNSHQTDKSKINK